MSTERFVYEFKNRKTNKTEGYLSKNLLCTKKIENAYTTRIPLALDMSYCKCVFSEYKIVVTNISDVITGE
jgi:hypothetical protein